MINLRHLISAVPVEFLRRFDGKDSSEAGRRQKGVQSWLSCKWPGGRTREFTELPAAEDNNNNAESDAFVSRREMLPKKEKVFA